MSVPPAEESGYQRLKVDDALLEWDAAPPEEETGLETPTPPGPVDEGMPVPDGHADPAHEAIPAWQPPPEEPAPLPAWDAENTLEWKPTGFVPQTSETTAPPALDPDHLLAWETPATDGGGEPFPHLDLDEVVSGEDGASASGAAPWMPEPTPEISSPPQGSLPAVERDGPDWTVTAAESNAELDWDAPPAAESTEALDWDAPPAESTESLDWDVAPAAAPAEMDWDAAPAAAPAEMDWDVAPAVAPAEMDWDAAPVPEPPTALDEGAAPAVPAEMDWETAPMAGASPDGEEFQSPPEPEVEATAPIPPTTPPVAAMPEPLPASAEPPPRTLRDVHREGTAHLVEKLGLTLLPTVEGGITEAEAVFFSTLPTELGHLRVGDSVSPSMVHLRVAARPMALVLSAALLTLALLLGGWGVVLQDESSTLDIQNRQLKSRLQQVRVSVPPDTRVKPREMIAFLLELNQVREMTPFKDVVSELSAAMSANMQVEKLRIERPGGRYRITLDGRIDSGFAQSQDAWQLFQQKLRQGGYQVVEQTFSTTIDASTFHLLLDRGRP